MKKLLLTLVLGALIGVGLAVVVAVVWNTTRAQQSAVQQPAEPQAGPLVARRAGLPVVLALACTCNLSVVALLGSLALRRRMDRISPDRAGPDS